MKTIFNPWIGCLVGLLMMVSCGQKYAGYQCTDDGLCYRFIEMDSTRPQPQQGDFLKLSMDYYLNNSLMYSSVPHGEYPRIQLKPSSFKGDILCGLAMMHEGDSASFVVRADSTWLSMFGDSEKGPKIQPKDKMRFEIRLLQIQSKEEFITEVEALYESMKADSDQELQSYLAEKHINTIDQEPGVYYWTTLPGTGKQPNPGDLVSVHYEGRFLNGLVFDSLYRSDTTFSFVLGRGLTLPGWEEVIPKMHVGECATVLIPYPMAYGDRSVGVIPPYSNLIYDIELLDVVDASIVEAQYRERMEVLKAQADQEFKTYVETQSIDVTPTSSGLYIIPRKQGSGAQARTGMVARVKYEARTLGGDLLGFSDSPYQEVVLGEGMLMPGVEEGLLAMSEGDSVTLLMPYPLAYGAQGYGNIQPYTNVVLGLSLLQLLPLEMMNNTNQ